MSTPRRPPKTELLEEVIVAKHGDRAALGVQLRRDPGTLEEFACIAKLVRHGGTGPRPWVPVRLVSVAIEDIPDLVDALEALREDA